MFFIYYVNSRKYQIITFEPTQAVFNYLKTKIDYKLMNLYHEIVYPVNKFFDNVMVNVEDLDLKNSRIGFLNNILIELQS